MKKYRVLLITASVAKSESPNLRRREVIPIAFDAFVDSPMIRAV
jgi:hypothetical protein